DVEDELVELAVHPVAERDRKSLLVLACQDGIREEVVRCSFQRMLQVAVAKLDVSRKGRCELDDLVIDERDARLETVCHRDTILNVQKSGEQRLEVEVRHCVEVRFLADVVSTEDRPERLEWMVIP